MSLRGLRCIDGRVLADVAFSCQRPCVPSDQLCLTIMNLCFCTHTDGHTYEQIADTSPEEYHARQNDKLRYRCVFCFFVGWVA